MLWSPTIRAALLAETPGSTSSARGAEQAGRSISEPLTGVDRHAGARAAMRLVSGLGADAEAPQALRPTAREPRPPRDRLKSDGSVNDVVPAIPNVLDATEVLASRFTDAAQWLVLAV
jgi:hypothetical protein